MTDVNINIRGRDDGLGSTLDGMRERVEGLGAAVDDLNHSSASGGSSSREMVDMTPAEARIDAERSSRDTLRERQDQVRKEFEDARAANKQEMMDSWSEWSIQNKSGTFQDFQDTSTYRDYENSNRDLGREEQEELISVEREVSQSLRELIREMNLQNRAERERRQRDNEEHRNNPNPDDDEESERSPSSPPPPGSTDSAIDSERSGGNTNVGVGLMGMGNAAAHGNLPGVVTGGINAGSGLLGVSKAGAAVAAAFLAAYGLIDAGDQVINAAGEAGALRGQGTTGAGTMRGYAENVDADGQVGNLGMKTSDFLGIMKTKAQESGMATNLRDRTMEDLAFQRGFGADAGVMSKFERFFENGETSTQVSLDVLNVLTSIERSSLKEGDLATLQEKLNIQSNLYDIQRSKRDAVNVDDSLRIMAAFESLGLSQKGERGGEFLQSTIQGLGEGGGDNAMLLKYEVAKRARPDLANDPAALRRYVKFHNDDPEYIKQAFGFFGDITKGNKMAQDDLLYTIFDPKSELDMEMWEKAMSGSGQFNELLSGRGVNKGRKGTLGRDQMYNDAEAATGGLTGLISDFKNQISDIGLSISTFFEDITATGGKAINMQPRGLPTYNPKQNLVKTGKK